jgi:uncharacterized protein YraI
VVHILRPIVRFLGLGLLILFFTSLALAQDATVTRNVNLRSDPSTANPPIRLLSPAEQLTLIEAGTISGYYHVKTQDAVEGWVWGRNLQVGTVTGASRLASSAIPSGSPKAAPAAVYPNPAQTPGVPNPDITQANIGDNICNKHWSTSSIRPSTSVTGPIKTQTMQAYGFTDSSTHYELDHLVSLQDGGCPDCVENLWPEPYGDAAHPMTQSQRAAWNKNNPDSSEVLPGALEKDMVENHVHDEMCFAIPNAKMSSLVKKFPPTVSITLQRGQEILATDWYACYLDMTQRNKPCE